MQKRRVEMPVLYCAVFLAPFLLGVILEWECFPYFVQARSTLDQFIPLYRMGLFTAAIALVLSSHGITSNKYKKDVMKSLYEGLKCTDLLGLRLPRLSLGMVGLLLLLSMLVFFILGLNVAFFIQFLTIVLLVIGNCAQLVRISSEKALRNAFESIFEQLPKKIAKDASKRPKLYLDMLRGHCTSSFEHLLQQRNFNLSKEQLSVFLFLYLSYHEVFWEEEKSDRKLVFLGLYRTLLDANGRFITNFDEATWCNLRRWVRSLKENVFTDAYSQKEYSDLVAEIQEDYCKLCTGEPFLPKRKIITAMQFIT